MSEEAGCYQVKIERWSATDFAWVVNNTSGWVSDDQKWFIFEHKEECQAFLAFLNDEK